MKSRKAHSTCPNNSNSVANRQTIVVFQTVTESRSSTRFRGITWRNFEGCYPTWYLREPLGREVRVEPLRDKANNNLDRKTEGFVSLYETDAG